MTITPLRNDQDQTTHFIAIKEDITPILESQDLLESRLAEVNALNSVAVAVIEENDEDRLISRVTSILGEIFYSDHFGILLLSKDGQDLIIHPSYQGIEAESRSKKFPLGESVVGRVASGLKAIVIEDVTRVKDYIGGTTGVQSELAVPVISEGQLLGVINAESRELGRFTEEDARLMTTAAGMLGSALSQIRINQQEREQRKISEVLAEIALALNSSLEVEKILDQILNEIFHMIPYKTASLFIRNNDEARVFRHRGYREIGLEDWIEEFLSSIGQLGDPLLRGNVLQG